MTENFDSLNIAPYFEKTFITKNSEYKITSEGKILGRKSVEGASIMMIAGINPENRNELLSAFHHSKEAYDRVLKEKAVHPDGGKCLAISLTPEDAIKKARNGFVSSIIDRIE